MNAVVQSVPLNQLRSSALNVRKTGGANIEDLAASIRARGLIHNLSVFARSVLAEIRNAATTFLRVTHSRLPWHRSGLCFATLADAACRQPPARTTTVLGV
jgi:hypothetical protein